MYYQYIILGIYYFIGMMFSLFLKIISMLVKYLLKMKVKLI